MTEQIHRQESIVRAGGLLGLSLIISAAIASWAFYAVHAMDKEVVTATGSAKERVVADKAKWTGEITRKVSLSDPAGGYVLLARDVSQLREFLKAHKVDPNALEVRTVFAQEDMFYGSEGPRSLGTQTLRQTVVLNADDVEGITKIADDLKDVIIKGVPVTTMSVEYFYGKLPEMRVKLLGGAITDAKARADEIAKAGGRTVGKLQSASSGVVQVLPINSVEISDYGTYDTSSKEKDVMVTVRATFGVN